MGMYNRHIFPGTSELFRNSVTITGVERLTFPTRLNTSLFNNLGDIKILFNDSKIIYMLACLTIPLSFLYTSESIFI